MVTLISRHVHELTIQPTLLTVLVSLLFTQLSDPLNIFIQIGYRARFRHLVPYYLQF